IWSTRQVLQAALLSEHSLYALAGDFARQCHIRYGLVFASSMQGPRGPLSSIFCQTSRWRQIARYADAPAANWWANSGSSPLCAFLTNRRGYPLRLFPGGQSIHAYSGPLHARARACLPAPSQTIIPGRWLDRWLNDEYVRVTHW